MILQYLDENLTHQVFHFYIPLGHVFRYSDQTWRCTYFGVELPFVAGILLLKDP